MKVFIKYVSKMSINKSMSRMLRIRSLLNCSLMCPRSCSAPHVYRRRRRRGGRPGPGAGWPTHSQNTWIWIRRLTGEFIHQAKGEEGSRKSKGDTKEMEKEARCEGSGKERGE